jgi:hypothetical protein
MAYVLPNYTPLFAETFNMLDIGDVEGILVKSAPASRPALMRTSSNGIL